MGTSHGHQWRCRRTDHDNEDSLQPEGDGRLPRWSSPTNLRLGSDRSNGRKLDRHVCIVGEIGSNSPLSNVTDWLSHRLTV